MLVAMEGMLRTGEVARMLGVSRQHVVDMCDQGHLSFVRVGTHRRIPRNEVERLTRRKLTREEEKSLWLHQAILAALLSDPDAVVARARENLTCWRALHRPDGRTVACFRKWETVLDQGLDAIIEMVTGTSEEACELRQNSPFAGVLSDEVRVRVLRSFRDHWTREHEVVPA